MPRRLLPLLLLAALPLIAAETKRPLLPRQTVYILPMTGGLDQYLATQLTRDGVYTITTDPAKATAILTDRLGTGFEQRLDELYVPPAPPKKEEVPAGTMDFSSGEKLVRISTWGRGRGTVFLVDRKNRQVLWSTYARPKRTTAHELNRMADHIADQLRHDTQP